jgi:hypothetical protein
MTNLPTITLDLAAAWVGEKPPECIEHHPSHLAKEWMPKSKRDQWEKYDLNWFVLNWRHDNERQAGHGTR